MKVNMLKKIFSQNQGFTLTEIITVIIILGVVSSFAIPRFSDMLERVRAAEGVHILSSLREGQMAYLAENDTYSAVLADLDVEIPSAEYFGLPPTVDDPADPIADPIAEITRTNSYTLGINEDGDVSCTNGGGTPDFTCAQAGY